MLLRGGQLTVGGSGLDGAAAIDLGGGTLRVTSGATTGFGGVIGGSGNLTMAGAGTLTLSGANTFAGTVRVDTGSLLFRWALTPDATDVPGLEQVAQIGVVSDSTASAGTGRLNRYPW